MQIPGDHLGAELIRVGGNDRDRQLNQVLQHCRANNTDNDGNDADNNGVMVMLLRNTCLFSSSNHHDHTLADIVLLFDDAFEEYLFLSDERTSPRLCL